MILKLNINKRAGGMDQEVIQMNIPDIIAYIVIGYLFVTLTVLYLLSRNTSSVDKIVGQSRKNLDIFEENEEYRKAA